MVDETSSDQARPPWNAGGLVGHKSPRKQRDIWTIGAQFRHQQRFRVLPLFNVAIDGKLRVCGLVHLRVVGRRFGWSLAPESPLNCRASQVKP